MIKAEIVNIFFSNTFKNLRIPQREEVDPFADKLSHLILKLIFKYSKNVKFVALNNAGNGWTFQFSGVSIDEDVFKEIKNSVRVKLPRVMKLR